MGGAVSLGDESVDIVDNDDGESPSFAQSVKLNVQLPEPHSKVIEVFLEDDLDYTVEYIKRMLEPRTKRACGIDRNDMQLWFKGWLLDEEQRTLHHHGVTDGSTLCVVNGAKAKTSSNTSEGQHEAKGRARSRTHSSDLTSEVPCCSPTPTPPATTSMSSRKEKLRVTVDMSCVEEGAYVVMHLFPDTTLHEFKTIIADRTGIAVENQLLRKKNGAEEVVDVNSQPFLTILELGIVHGSELEISEKGCESHEAPPQTQQQMRAQRKQQVQEQDTSSSRVPASQRRSRASARRRRNERIDSESGDEGEADVREPLVEVHVHGPGGATFAIEVSPRSTLKELKEHLYVRSGVRTEEQSLTFQGETTKLIDDRQTLEGYFIDNGTSLVLK